MQGKQPAYLVNILCINQELYYPGFYATIQFNALLIGRVACVLGDQPAN